MKKERKKGGAGGGDSPSRESWMGGVVGAGSDTKEWPGKVESSSYQQGGEKRAEELYSRVLVSVGKG